MRYRYTKPAAGCGGEMVIAGRIGDDLRLAGMSLTLGSSSSVGDDALWAGLRLLTEPGSTAGGSLLFAGYQALLAGRVAEGVAAAVVHLELQGVVGGDVRLDVSGSGLTVADSARIGGTLTLEPEPTRATVGTILSAVALRLLPALLIVAVFWSWSVVAQHRTVGASV